jgi:cytochrome b
MVARTRVWDPFVRVFHWLLAIGFAVSYVSEGEPLFVHVWSGYLIGALIVLRAAWGFTGPRHARFSDFVYRPGKVLAYLLDLLKQRAPRYLGHSPAGGAMSVLLLLSLATTVGTGLAVYAQEKGAGPLATVVSRAAPDAAEDGLEDGAQADGPQGQLAELHELLANLTLVLVLVHVGGVMLTSLAHRENLPWAMITGLKRR